MSNNEAYCRYAAVLLISAFFTIPYCGVTGLVAACVALVFLRVFVDHLPP